MPAIRPTLAFGNFELGEWVSRYCRLAADLPAGRHVLAGEIYNPEGDDLVGNGLAIALPRQPVGVVENLASGESRAFRFELPLLAAPERVAILLRTSRWRLPPPPDERLLGVVVLKFEVQTQA